MTLGGRQRTELKVADFTGRKRIPGGSPGEFECHFWSTQAPPEVSRLLRLLRTQVRHGGPAAGVLIKGELVPVAPRHKRSAVVVIRVQKDSVPPLRDQGCQVQAVDAIAGGHIGI